jgi:hypothetical protein
MPAVVSSEGGNVERDSDGMLDYCSQPGALRVACLTLRNIRSPHLSRILPL